MKETLILMKVVAVVIALLGCGVLLVNTVWAHCDTLNGPVASAAKAALEKGDVTPVLKWVKKEHEAEVKAVFQTARAVRAKGPDAKDLADRYFLETLVRLHRATEGEPYTGIKAEPVEPIVALADQALASGSADEMLKKITADIAEGVNGRLNKAMEARKHADESVEAGRKYVEAYVQYVHYVEGIHSAAANAGAHARAADGSHVRSEGH
jgi:hypothetical protein